MQKPGILYIVATPIGNLADISQRALQVLQSVDLIAAEDTRHSGKLLQHYSIRTPMIALHDYNEKERIELIIQRLQAGENLALISDAGTPLISDPGYRLVKAAHVAKIKVVPIPGACAAIVALSASGLPTDSFLFLGFMPSKSSARQHQLLELQNETRTLVFYEAPHRILDLIADMILVWGEHHLAVLAKELTKTYETIYPGTLAEINSWLQSDEQRQKGEFIVLLHGAEKMNMSEKTFAQSEKVLKILLKELPVKQAIKIAVELTGEKKNQLYTRALDLIKERK